VLLAAAAAAGHTSDCGCVLLHKGTTTGSRAYNTAFMTHKERSP
jgi:hypothetical protein